MLEDDWCERPDLACAMVWVSLPDTDPAEEEEEQREMDSERPDLGLARSTLPETAPAEKEEEQREMNSLMSDLGLGLASSTLPETSPAEVEQAQAERVEQKLEE